MRQLNYVEARTLAWHDVPAPSLLSDQVAEALAEPFTKLVLTVDEANA